MTRGRQKCLLYFCEEAQERYVNQMKCGKIVYSVISEETELGVQFGIVCENDGERFLAIHEISPDRETVEKLSSVCNQGELAPGHLKDVVEDSLI